MSTYHSPISCYRTYYSERTYAPPKYDDDLLDTLWTEARWRDLPDQIRPLPDSIQQAVWRLNRRPEIILISTVGDVTLPRTTSKCT